VNLGQREDVVRERIERMGVERVLAAGAALVFTIWLSLPAGATSYRAECGVERWTVKTLQDRPALIPAQTTTIAYLTSRHPPASLPDTRLPFERHIFTVTAAVVLIRHEADDDFHVVLSDGHRTMITEAPAPECDTRAYTRRQAEMAAARQALRPCSRARVTGVAFFDFEHGQTGVAPNAIELHPILAFRCLTGGGTSGSPPASPTPPTGVSHSGKVRQVSLTSPVSAGSDATLVVAVPSGTPCSIVVTYKSGPSEAAGLYPQRARAGRITWTWTVGTRTTPGRWPIDVSCGAAGDLHTSFVVT
jgi:hypothetical protein